MAKEKPHAAPKASAPHATCGAKTKSKGTPCTKAAGWRTDHPGEGRCYLHGGATPPKSHGRYSTITRTRIKELLETFEQDEDPGNLLPEIHLLRAMVVDFIERYDTFTEALVAWHESWNSGASETPKPRQVVDILSVGKFIGEIGSLVDKIQKQKQEGMVSFATVNRAIEAFGMEVVSAAQEVIPDADTRTALLQSVEQRWGAIRLDPVKPGSKGSS